MGPKNQGALRGSLAGDVTGWAVRKRCVLRCRLNVERFMSHTNGILQRSVSSF